MTESEDLFQACKNGNIPKVKSLTKKSIFHEPVDVNARDNHGRTALMYAAHNRELEIVKLLTAKGADVNAKDRSGNTVLIQQMSEFAGFAIVEHLVRHGADVNVRNNAGSTALTEALKHGRADYVVLLIRNDAYLDAKDVNVKDQDGRPGWMKVMYSVEHDIVSQLIRSGADVNARDQWGWTPLLRCAEHGDPALVKLLIQNGADVNARSSDSRTALTEARLREIRDDGDLERSKRIINTLKEAGAHE